MKGRYRISTQYSSHPNRATNVKITVFDLKGERSFIQNQRKDGGFSNELGIFEFDPAVTTNSPRVVIRTLGADGHVTTDAIKVDFIGGAAEGPIVEDPAVKLYLTPSFNKSGKVYLDRPRIEWANARDAETPSKELQYAIFLNDRCIQIGRLITGL